MTPERPACWERKRDAPHLELDPHQFFQETANGVHCGSNWYEGNYGGMPPFTAAAPALLGFDDYIAGYWYV